MAHKPVTPDPEQIENAQAIWGGFTNLIKYSLYAVIATLVVLGLALIKW
ncbi:MAG: hypothetical protein KDJ35_03275 [Alphaproteobacteria bacterium]|nr:hypothetical protein [Alphaproteobacteria bacterium]